MTLARSLTLLADGTSDRVLLHLIELLMNEHCPDLYESKFVEWLPPSAQTTTQRVKETIVLYPSDLLFVHRDAENIEPSARESEIRQGLAGVLNPPHLICVIPVRMTEAWLLTSEAAIRAAVGNPNGQSDLALPHPNKVESVDAKSALFKALEAAKDLGANRTRRFRPEKYRHRVAELLPDLDGLRKLPSFRHLESQVASHFSS